MIANLLHPYREQLAGAYEPYLNHAARVFYIAKTLAPLDEPATEKLAIACAFHDLGIWTDDTWDYLHPSAELCSRYLNANGKAIWTEEVLLMLHHHHKVLPYNGPYASSVELFRKADLIDFSAGIVRFGLPKERYCSLLTSYPRLGFHGILFHQFYRHFLRKPWNPLPMVKW